MMTQVEYNRRYAQYMAELRTVLQRYAALKTSVEPGSIEEEGLESQETIATNTIRARFVWDTAGTITAY